MFRVLSPTFKPVLQQIRFLEIALILTSNWIKSRGNHAICTGVLSLAATEVCPGSVERAKLKEFVVKKVELLTPYYLRNLQQPIFFFARQA